MAAGVVALAVYLATSAPSITWQNEAADSGDLATAAFTLGIPHPSGYPLYTLISALFARLPWGEPAHNLGLFSALAAACAVIVVSRSARVLMRAHGREPLGTLGPALLALTLGFSPLFWSQATVAEIYALSALFAAALVAALLVSAERQPERVAGIFGLGLAHHLTIVLLIPMAALLMRRVPWRRMARAVGLSAGALLLYLYLPFRAGTHPPVNWGDPHTLEGFFWTVSGAAYRPYLFHLTPAEALGRVAAVAQMLFLQFQPWGVLLGLWGIARMAGEPRVRRLLAALGVGAVLPIAYAVLYSSRNSFVYLIPFFILFVLCMAYGVGDLAKTSRPAARIAIMALLLFLPVYNLAANYSSMDLSKERGALEYAQAVFAQVPKNAVVIADGDKHLFALWYYRYVIVPASSQVDIVSEELLQYDWYDESVRRMMPSLRPVPEGAGPGSLQRARLGEIVDRSLAEGRAVYATATGDWLAGYTYQPTGALLWIQIRRP